MRGRRLRPSDGKYRNGSYSQSDNRSRARSGANIVYLPARTRRATAKRPLDITPICPEPQTQADMPPTHVRGSDPLDWPGQADPISPFGHFKRNLVSKGRSRLTKPQFTHGANWGLLRVMRLKCPKLNVHCQHVANLSFASALSAVLRTPPRGERPRRSESYRHASTQPP